MRVLLCFLLCSLLACAQSQSGAAVPEIGTEAVSRAQGNRKMSYSGSLSLEVSQVEGLDEKTRKVVEEIGGWVSSSSTSEKRYSASIRVPADKLQGLIRDLSTLGEVESSNLNAEDVTDAVLDLESRLKNLRALRDRYHLLLERTKEVKDLLSVEQELNRIEGEIERLEASLQNYEKRVTYSTLNFSAEESTVYGPLGLAIHGTIWVVSKLFVLQ